MKRCECSVKYVNELCAAFGDPTNFASVLQKRLGVAVGAPDMTTDEAVRAMRDTDLGQFPPDIPYQYLSEWTKDFAADKKIGEGAFGEVQTTLSLH